MAYLKIWNELERWSDKEIILSSSISQSRRGRLVTFPDLPECITEGYSIEEAYEMAVDALGLALTDRMQAKEELPAASGV